MYPNRRAARISDPVLRAAIYSAAGKNRKMYEGCYPEYYSRDPDEFCVPHSLLKQMSGLKTLQTKRFAAAEFARRVAVSREVSWYESGLFEFEDRAFDLEMYSWSQAEGRMVPEEVWVQIRSHELRGGMEVKYKGQTYVVIELFLGDDGPQPGELIRRLPDNYEIIIIHARHIDFGA